MKRSTSKPSGAPRDPVPATLQQPPDVIGPPRPASCVAPSGGGGAATQVPIVQTSPGGHVAPTQSSTQAPPTQCVPVAQLMPMHEASRHMPLASSQVRPGAQAAQTHES